MAEPEKRCCHCKEVKSLKNFRKDKRTSDGLNRRCNVCDSDRGKTYYQSKSESEPEYYQNQHLKQRFGITLVDYDKMAEIQNGVCDICGGPEKRKNVSRLSVDHDHATGKIRALLCDRCNRLIGMAEEDIILLNKAIKYLRRFQ